MVGAVRDRLELGWVAARNLVLGTNVRALAAGPHPKALAYHVTELLFLQQALLRGRGVPERAVTALIGDAGTAVDAAAVNLDPASATLWFDGSPSYAVDLVSLCLLCRVADPAPRNVFEIGTSIGTTALHFALNTPPGTRIHTLDLPPGDVPPPVLRTTTMDDAHIRGRRSIQRYVFDGRPEAERIECLYGDSATFDFTPYEGAIDLFFIDGAHSYEYVRADTLNALRCCRPGAILAWHDFGRRGVNGVTRWVRQFRRESGRDVYVTPGGSVAYTVV